MNARGSDPIITANDELASVLAIGSVRNQAETNGVWRLVGYRCVFELGTLGAEGVLPSRHIESFLRVFKQFTHNLPSR